VFLLSFGMFASTFLLGILPQVLKLNKTLLDLVSIFGAGLLVGAALLIIIPEGLMVLISSEIKVGSLEESAAGKVDPEFLQQSPYFDAEDLSKEIGVALTSGFVLMLVIDQLSHMITGKAEQHSSNEYE
jgi:solute carrier family 39 (zinc transporter), member 9